MLRPVAIFALGIALLALLVGAQLNPVAKFALGVAGMVGIGKMLAQELKIKDDFGMLMVRSQAGIGAINALARHEYVWKFLADVGVVLAYGAASFFIIKRPLKERAAILFCGLVTLSVVAIVVTPAAYSVLLGVLGGGGDVGAGAKAAGTSYTYAFLGLMYIGGLALLSFSSLVAYSGVVLSAAIGTYVFGTGAMGNTAPGATFILPGINIPFVEGIMALALILLVHEGGHAILARVGRVRILSSGVVLLGVIPIGAFVEPDEEALQKTDSEKQTRVLVAGSTANFLAAIAVFALFILFLTATASSRESGVLVLGGNMSGNVVYSINGQQANTFLNSTNISVNETLVFAGDRGTYSYLVGAQGIRYYDLSTNFLVARYANPIYNFLYSVLGLAFSLNIVIGMVNLLPVPFFDGYRLLEINMDRKKLVTIVAWITGLAFLVNFLPWIL